MSAMHSHVAGCSVNRSLSINFWTFGLVERGNIQNLVGDNPLRRHLINFNWSARVDQPVGDSDRDILAD